MKGDSFLGLNGPRTLKLYTFLEACMTSFTMWFAFTWTILPCLLSQKEQVRRLHLLLTVKDSADNVPKNLEARRRLEFFTNSLFMDMPSAKPVSEMMPFRYLQVKRSDFPCQYQTCHFNFVLFVCSSIVSSPHITVRQCCTLTLNCGLKMRMEYLFFSIFRRFFQVCLFLYLSIRNHFYLEALLKKENTSTNQCEIQSTWNVKGVAGPEITWLEHIVACFPWRLYLSSSSKCYTLNQSRPISKWIPSNNLITEQDNQKNANERKLSTTELEWYKAGEWCTMFPSHAHVALSNNELVVL